MFLDGVVHQLEVFSASLGLAPEHVNVHLIFADGESAVVKGLRVTEPFGSGDWAMIQGSGREGDRALVIREDDVRRVEFQPARPKTNAMGFTAEAESPQKPSS
jgi:hypothetical protein